MATILIVDDSRFMRKILSNILSEEGHRVVAEAENAKEAIELYNRLKPDLVTLDIILPDVEGVDAISALKSIRKTNPLAKVLVVSAMNQLEVAGEFARAGASGFIGKPIEPENVAEEVERVLGNG